MEIFCDLHIHSRFSRACSSKISVKNLEIGAREKGIHLLGTGDFTHEKWLNEIKNSTEEEDGILKTKNGFSFLLTGEVSNIFFQNGKQRRIHSLIIAPSIDVVEQIRYELLKKGNLNYDGRPTFGMSCIELADIIFSVSEDCIIIPAHCMTPWYGIFGSKSGFDSVEECYEEYTKKIFALETGLSATPDMLWRISSLDKFNLVSFSDAHSIGNIGRECVILDLKKLTYKNIVQAIKENKIKTIEFYAEEGKYHYDGHRFCNVCLSPKEAIRLNNICPVCKKPLTIGVAHRVEELADREEGFVPKNCMEFKKLVPLKKLIAAILNIGEYTKKVNGIYSDLIKNFGSEFDVLLKVEENDLCKVAGEKITKWIIKNRDGKIKVKPGYDGVYGKIVIEDSVDEEKQSFLSGFIQNN